jgi:hypothetical protein
MLKLMPILLFGTVLLYSCGNGSGEKPVDGIIHDTTIPAPDLDSVVKGDSVVTASYHLSKEDSIKVADSVKRTKNPIRDFN